MRLRHSEAVCVAQFLLWPGVQLVPISPYLLVPMYQISPNSSLSDHLWPASLVCFVQELVLGGMGLVQTARSTLAPTMAVTERKK